MSEAIDKPGKAVRVSGPIVEAEGMASAGAFEMVKVGPKGFVGEVLKLKGDIATIQVYEYTGGLGPGVDVVRTGYPLSAVLAPGLLGSIFDGVQRPLTVLAALTGAFLHPGVAAEPLDVVKKWHFTPTVAVGAQLKGGQIFGTVQETQTITHRLMVPPLVSGRVAIIAPEGEYNIKETICTLEDGKNVHELSMTQRWPMRQARPFRSAGPARTCW